VKADSAVAVLQWEKVAVPFAISVDVHDIVKASLHNQLQGLAQYTWEGWDDAANYLLAEKYDLDEALKYEDTSVKTEERYDNLMTKSQILKAMGREQDATVTKNRAIEVATAFQLYGYGRQLQRDGKQDEAFTIYRQAVKKNPNDWVALLGSARIHSAAGDYDSALKEVKLSQAGAPDNQKVFLVQMIQKLENKQDINKN
jgi:tetratricopeptide (TPR) repeat protein